MVDCTTEAAKLGVVAEAAGVAELLRALTALNIVCVACFFFPKVVQPPVLCKLSTFPPPRNMEPKN